MAGKPKSGGGSSFSAARMFDELEKGPPLVLTGMVKRDDNDPNVVLFAPPNDCSRWLPIPQELIRRYEYLGRVPCQDHTHPLVHLYLSRPENREQEVYAAARPLERGARITAAAATGPFGGGTDCVWNRQLRMWVIPGTNPPVPCVPTAPAVAAAGAGPLGGGTDCVWNRELGMWVVPGSNPPVPCTPTFVA